MVLAELQRDCYDATHHCSAWRLRDGVWRANDAGEPGGSAGAPILAAVDAAGVTDAVVVVVRFFGGTKLGVGGLIRAYGEAAEAALARAPRRVGTPAAQVVIRYPYPHTSAVMRSLESSGAAAIEHGYSDAASVAEVSAVVPDHALDRLFSQLRELTSGEIAPEVTGGALLYHSPGG